MYFLSLGTTLVVKSATLAIYDCTGVVAPLTTSGNPGTPKCMEDEIVTEFTIPFLFVKQYPQKIDK